MFLEKGNTINFLNYTIKNCLNDDGMVLYKEDGKLYETHLGNYGEGSESNVNYAKKDAIRYFMVVRPHIFATHVVRIMRGGGTYHEFYKFKQVCEQEGIELPEEISCGDGMNCMLYFNGEEL